MEDEQAKEEGNSELEVELTEDEQEGTLSWRQRRRGTLSWRWS